MFPSFSFQGVVRRSLALAIVAGASAVAVQAQAVPATDSTDATHPFPFASAVRSGLPLSSPEFLFSSSVSSSSDDATDAAAQAATMNLASLEKNFGLPGANAQYGRRRYGAPRYRGGNTNPDGSEKYDAFVGGGFTLPIGNTHHYDTPSWGFQVGAGRNFNKAVGVNLQFDWDNFGLQSSTIQQQTFIYDPTGAQGLQGYLDGHSHVWSLSVDPIFNLRSGEGLGAYVTAGGGFYHKTTTFTVPQEEEILTYFGYETYVANEPIDSYTSNAPGVNGGFGLTYKFSRFANERFYAEVRYVVTFNSQRQGVNGSNYNDYADVGYAYPTANLYPANSNRSTYLPIKFGLRF